MMKRSLVLLLGLLCAPLSWANDYPTQARVEYVLRCMHEHGGQSYDTLYPCICSIDKIASKLDYAQYVDAETLTVMVKTPGEKGGVFRDAAPQSRKRVKGFAEIRREAEAACFVGASAAR